MGLVALVLEDPRRAVNSSRMAVDVKLLVESDLLGVLSNLGALWNARPLQRLSQLPVWVEALLILEPLRTARVLFGSVEAPRGADTEVLWPARCCHQIRVLG